MPYLKGSRKFVNAIFGWSKVAELSSILSRRNERIKYLQQELTQERDANEYWTVEKDVLYSEARNMEDVFRRLGYDDQMIMKARRGEM